MRRVKSERPKPKGPPVPVPVFWLVCWFPSTEATWRRYGWRPGLPEPYQPRGPDFASPQPGWHVCRSSQWPCPAR